MARVTQVGLHRQHHARLERAVLVVAVVADDAGRGETRRLVRDEPHAVGDERQLRSVRALALTGTGGLYDVAAAAPCGDRRARCLLYGSDLLEQLGRPGVDGPHERHPGEVADVALQAATGVQAAHLAQLPADGRRRRPVEARADARLAELEGQPPPRLLEPQPLRELRRRDPGPGSGEHGLHRADDPLGGGPDELELVGALHRAQLVEDAEGVDQLHPGKLAHEGRIRVLRQE